jgi:hypothetical protein
VSVETLAGLCAIAASLVFILAAMLALGLRAARIAQRARRLREHPVALALPRFEAAAQELGAAAARLATMRQRFEDLARSARRLSAAAGSLDLSVDRLAFATRLVLHMFEVRA